MTRLKIILYCTVSAVFYLSSVESLALNCTVVPPGDVSQLKTCITNVNAGGGGTIFMGSAVYTLLAPELTDANGAVGLPIISTAITFQDGAITRDPSGKLQNF